MRHPRLMLLLAVLAVWPSGALAAPLGTAIAYQGRLTDGGSPASGNYDLQFTLKDAASGGSTVGSPVTLTNVAVSNGLFTVSLDFGAAVFVGDARWLEIGVRPGGTDPNPFTLLAGRQELTPSPNAIYSATTGDPAVQRRSVSPACPSGQYVQGLAADGTPTCAPDLDSGGTVTSVTAGSGLSGGTFTSSGTIAVDFAGSGAAATVSRSDHDHFGGAWSGTGTLWGLSVSNTAAAGVALGGYANDTTTENFGVLGRSSSTQGYGVYGWAQATSGFARGVYGSSSSSGGVGVHGSGQTGVRGSSTATTGTAWGVEGSSSAPFGRGVYGIANGTSGVSSGVYGTSSSSAGRGVYGRALSSVGETTGVWGETSSSEGRGLYGWASSTSGTAVGIRGQSDADSGVGVVGHAFATSGPAIGMIGQSSSSIGVGVRGMATSSVGITSGVEGSTSSPDGRGVVGWAFSTTGVNYGVYGAATSTAGFAGYFSGAVSVTGFLSKSGGGFKIDHPLDPENRYLNHSFVESPDMKNLYDGVVTTDENGFATIALPAWFEALNSDFRYQVTVLDEGDSAVFVQAKVVRKIANDRFTIRTSLPGVEVSWQVTGTRKDAWALANPMPVEEDKNADEQGTLIAPEAFGAPPEKGRDFKRRAPEPKPPESPGPDFR